MKKLIVTLILFINFPKLSFSGELMMGAAYPDPYEDKVIVELKNKSRFDQKCTLSIRVKCASSNRGITGMVSSGTLTKTLRAGREVEVSFDFKKPMERMRRTWRTWRDEGSMITEVKEDSLIQKCQKISGSDPGPITDNENPHISPPGPAFVEIPAGTFMMGSNEYGDEEPPHRVTITRDFEMGKYEVTQLQWFNVMGNNPSSFKKRSNCLDTFKSINGINLCPNHPVEEVSWRDVQDFINKLNDKTNDGYTYRLPTEAEWEYAARAGTNSKYSFGNGESQLSRYAWYDDNSGSQTYRVGQKKPNDFGLYDMHGNVWEWVQDWYEDDYYENSPARNPAGPSSGSYRVVRGGSWNNDASHLRSANRNRNSPGYSYIYNGFRLLRIR